MKRLIAATAALATFALAAPASATVLTFEDITIPSPGNTPALTTYGGFSWNNAYAFDNTINAGTGLQGKPIGTKAIFGANGTFFQFTSASTFTFNSASFASALASDVLTITGYANANLTGQLFQQTITIGSSMAAFTFNWANVRGIEVRGRGNNYAADNITFNAVAGVPEPATWAMMMLGFGAMGYSLRRRNKVSARIRFA